MVTTECLGKHNLDVLHQLFAAATHEASAAMCQWTSSLITLTLDKVIDVPLEEVCSALGLREQLFTMVVLTLDGELGGSLVLAFDEHTGRQLAASLLGEPPQTSAQWSELEISALNETGNILGCAYMNAISRLINCQLIPSIPYFVQDFGASVVQQAVLGQATADSILVCRTGFHHQEQQGQHDEELMWWVLFVPSHELRRTLEHAINPER
jgi:chemotaxis protein CheC